VSENWVLRRIFGSKRDEVTGEWRKLHNKDHLNDLYSALNIIQFIKSRRMRLAGHAAYMGERRGMCSVLLGNVRKRGNFEHLGVDGRIILR